MKASEIRQKYLDFFVKLGHKIIQPASLVPENDPTTLFTSSGMQPLISYLKGEAHPMGQRLVDSQPSIRLQDIEEVGDTCHTTFFEMLGNWSLGDPARNALHSDAGGYFKKEQLSWFLEFLTKELKLPKEKLWVSVFEGSEEVPRDEESFKIWQDSGIVKDHIFFYGPEKNWWSRSGTPEEMPTGEIGGPDSEVFYDFGEELGLHGKFCKTSSCEAKCHPNCQCGRFLEIGNSVFMQYEKKADGKLVELPKKNVDFGGGLERLTAATNNDPDIFKIDLFEPIIKTIEEKIFTKFKYSDKNVQVSFRILADHVRAIVFLMAAGVLPSNKGQGYILRRLIRRSVMQEYKWGQVNVQMSCLIDPIVDVYKDTYPDLKKVITLKEYINDEEKKFMITLKQALKEWHKVLASKSEGMGPWGTQKFGEGPRYKKFLPEEVFKFITTYGLPIDIIRDELHWDGDYKKVEQLLDEHQSLSRTASAGMFRGGLADHSEEVTKLHTATHLLHATLRKILGAHVQQKGSNITAERLRFDFSHPQKMTVEELAEVEEMVNEKIKENLPVTMEIMDLKKAEESGALGFFKEKYSDKVKVYAIGPSTGSGQISFSKEICGGPHVDFTKKLERFKIIKEEAAGSGVRRIYATVHF